MPNKETFKIRPIGDWVDGWLSKIEDESDNPILVDPFAGNWQPPFGWKAYLNDIDPKIKVKSHLDAREFLDGLHADMALANVVIMDPPYSPRQVAEAYNGMGKKITTTDTQTARLKKECHDRIQSITMVGSVCLSFGWSGQGMGIKNGWELISGLLVMHGGDHNATICIAEERIE